MPKLLIAAASLALMAAPAVALADRPPTPEERAAVEGVLRANGYVTWEEIELDDDGYWEVDDARTANPADRDVDVKIDPRTMAIIGRD